MINESIKEASPKQVDQIEWGLGASSRLSEETGHPGKGIRPCIATLYETPLLKGQFPPRSQVSIILASEFKRIGLDYDSIIARLEYWNRYNKPPLTPRDLERAVNNSISKDYKYTCGNPILRDFCVGREYCQFNQYVISKKKKPNDLKFIDYGWQKYLSNRQVLVFAVALPHLENTRKIGRGGLICANHKQIAEACGISPGRIGQDLRLLASVGLIEYNVGRPRKWEGIASEIRRIFPIPRPTRMTINLTQGFKNDMS